MIPEDELVVLERGMKSDFWALITARFHPQAKRLLRRMKEPDITTIERDRMVERLAMLDELLEWPSVRVDVLTAKLKESR